MQRGKLFCKKIEQKIGSLAFGLHLLGRVRLHIPFSQDRMKQLQMLWPGKSPKELEERDDCRRFTLWILLVIGTVFLTVVAWGGERGSQYLKGKGYLERREPGKGQQKAKLQIRGQGVQKKVQIVVPERKYRPEELQAKLEEGRNYIIKKYLGENKTAEKVTKSLCLVSEIKDSAIKVKWKLDADGYINRDGTLNNRALSQKTEVSITAYMVYGDVKEPVELELFICPVQKSYEQRLWENWESRLEEEKERSAQQKVLKLPREAAGRKLFYREVKERFWCRVFLAGGLLCICIPFLLDYQTEQGIKKRDRQLQTEYPEMVERFILLLGAGLTIRGTWLRIAGEYERRRASGEISYNYLYEEMLLTRNDMENGKSEAAAYTSFGRRISMLQYMKFSTLLVQNLKKGSDDLLRRMELEAEDAVRIRRELAKKQGEEAGTKLLLPMMLMLVVVFAIILTAAFRAM